MISRRSGAAGLFFTPPSKKKLIRIVRKSLSKAGWNIESSPHGSDLRNADFLAYRGNDQIAVMVSKHDVSITIVEVRDLIYNFISTGRYCVFVYADAIDSLILSEIEGRSALLIKYDQLDLLDEAIYQSHPRLSGAIDSVNLSEFIGGWAKLTPMRRRAKVIAFFQGRIVGEDTANRYRPDLHTLGDGNFGFRIPINPISDADSFKSNIVVRVYEDTKYIGILNIWDKIKFIR